MVHEKDNLVYETGEIKRVNANFVQFYDDHLDLIMLMTKENPTALNVFLWIVKHMDNRNALVVSQQAIAEALELHKNTVYLAVKYLKEKKALTVLRSSNSNVFAINAQIAWRDSADAKKYAHFDAKVYISELEQNEDLDKPVFETQLIGHVKKRTSKKFKTGQETPKKEIEKGFEALNKKIS
jgi:hypothetical protein